MCIRDSKDTLLERFANPNIKDSLARICSESSAKLSTFMLPTITENLATKGEIRCATLVIAAWCYYSDKQTDLKGNPLVIADAMADELHKLANKTNQNSGAFLELTSLFSELSNSEKFVTTYKAHVEALYSESNIKRHMQSML